MHPPVTVPQVWPCLARQVPLASQVPAQRPLGSSMLLTAAHVCVVVLQAMHDPVQSAFVQQPLVGMQTAVLPVVHDLVEPVQV